MKLKKSLFVFTFNITLFLLLIVGIQNSSKKKQVNLIINQTIELPVGFIVGVSFIAGSLACNILRMSIDIEQK